MKADTISFEPVTETFFPMLHDWLSQPHVRRWWGDPDEELGLIRSIVEGDDGTEGFVIFVGERPVGYIQSWRPANFTDEQWVEDAPWLSDVPQGTVGVDIFIGPSDLIGKGLGEQVIRAFARRLFEQGASRLIIDPDAANERAVRAYEKAGFTAFDTHKGKKETTLLMELTRENFLRNQ